MNKLSIFALAALVSVAACQPKDEAPATDEIVVQEPAADASAPALEPLPEPVDTTVADPEAVAPETETVEQPQH